MAGKKAVKAKDLQKKLMMNDKVGAKDVSASDIKKAFTFANEYMTFLDNSRTERDAVKYTVKLAKENGFELFDETKEYKPGDRAYIINRDKAIGLVVFGKKGTKEGVKLSIDIS